MKTENSGTIILGMTCVPQNISYPQDINFLNEAKEKPEGITDQICYEYNYYKPQMYHEKAGKDCESCRMQKRTAKKIHKAIKLIFIPLWINISIRYFSDFLCTKHSITVSKIIITNNPHILISPTTGNVSYF